MGIKFNMLATLKMNKSLYGIHNKIVEYDDDDADDDDAEEENDDDVQYNDQLQISNSICEFMQTSFE